MKKLFLVTFILFSLISLPSLSENLDDLVNREGLYYEKFSDVPFTGEIKGPYQGLIENGKKEGVWKVFSDRENLKKKYNFKNNRNNELKSLNY